MIPTELNCVKCLKNSFDPRIGFTDAKHMTISDYSEWMHNDRPEKYVITITNTTHNITNDVEILARGTNVLSTIELFGTKEKLCLQDGFYCISCESCGKKYTVNRAYVANTECMIDKLFIKASSDEEIKKVNDFYNDLDMVKKNTELGRLPTAQKTFNTLTKKLNQLGCEECGC